MDTPQHISHPDRRTFFRVGLGFIVGLTGVMKTLAESTNGTVVKPEAVVFADDGSIPNNVLPLLLYREAFSPDTPNLGDVIEQRFQENNWTGNWRAAVFPFHHYHSTTHEVLGIYRGSATIQLGGEKGRKFEVKRGDVIVIPAGVGHKRVNNTEDFHVVGGYPGGRNWDLLKGEPGERPKADENIAAVPMPKTDPLYGAEGPLLSNWRR